MNISLLAAKGREGEEDALLDVKEGEIETLRQQFEDLQGEMGNPGAAGTSITVPTSPHHCLLLL